VEVSEWARVPEIPSQIWTTLPVLKFTNGMMKVCDYTKNALKIGSTNHFAKGNENMRIA